MAKTRGLGNNTRRIVPLKDEIEESRERYLEKFVIQTIMELIQ